MTDRFIDVYSPPEFPGYMATSIPRYKTRIVTGDGGGSQTNVVWEDPLYDFLMPAVARKMEHFNALYHHWHVMEGPAHTWPLRDPMDFASVDLDQPNVEPTISMLDQTIGEADGVTTEFQLIKTYTRGDYTKQRRIFLPVLAGLVVAVDGVVPNAQAWQITTAYTLGQCSRDVGVNYICIKAHTSTILDRPGIGFNWQTYWAVGGGGFTVSRPGGVVTFDTAPGTGSPTTGVITAGFLFDNEVRFENDEAFAGICRNWNTAGYSDIRLIGERTCTDGD